MKYKFRFSPALANYSKIQVVREIKNILEVSLREAVELFDSDTVILDTDIYPNIPDLIDRLKEMDCKVEININK